jgi:hypothetical protein
MVCPLIEYVVDEMADVDDEIIQQLIEWDCDVSSETDRAMVYCLTRQSVKRVASVANNVACVRTAHLHAHFCRNPTLVKCEDETHTPKVGDLESSGTPENSELDCRGLNTLHLGVLHWKRSRSVDVQNGLALVIWTFAAQVMSKRRARSQIGSLTPDH